MSYAEQQQVAQQEQLDWLHSIDERLATQDRQLAQMAHQTAQQTEILARIARHTAFLQALAIVVLVLIVLAAVVANGSK